MILTANGESNFDTPGGRCHFSRTLHFSWPSHLYYSRIRKSWKSYGCWRRNSGAKKSQKLKECYPKTPKRKKIGSSNQDFSPAMFVRRDIWLICFGRTSSLRFCCALFPGTNHDQTVNITFWAVAKEYSQIPKCQLPKQPWYFHGCQVKTCQILPILGHQGLPFFILESLKRHLPVQFWVDLKIVLFIGNCHV